MRALIVDDEPLARRRLRRMLAEIPTVEIVGDCGNGADAIQAIAGKKPELILLDIQMPEIDGFGVIRGIGVEHCPAVIFVTAYDQYALQAFEIHAIDYLLKPFDKERLRSAIAHAETLLASRAAGAPDPRLEALLKTLSAPQASARRVAIKSTGRTYFVDADDIDWIESSGNYVTLHCGSHTHLLRETMKGIEDRLGYTNFRRIHRNIIVNLSRVKELKSWFHGDYILLLKNGVELSVSRRFRHNLDDHLG